MYVIFVVAIALIAGLFLLLDRGLKAIERGRRRRIAAARLDAVASKAVREHEKRREREETSRALTNVLPAIAQAELGPRKVDEPAIMVDEPAVKLDEPPAVTLGDLVAVSLPDPPAVTLGDLVAVSLPDPRVVKADDPPAVKLDVPAEQ
jgi:hypothetical protein